jgi:two-component system sensor histidine kinase DesK
MLIVADDGRGGVGQEGNGLRGMRERVEARGGKFTLCSDKGTELRILLPLEQPS